MNNKKIDNITNIILYNNHNATLIKIKNLLIIEYLDLIRNCWNLGPVLPILFSFQFSSIQFSLIQFSSVQISSDQFSSVQLLTILLLSHIIIHFSSVQFSSIRFRSVQLFYAEENRPQST